MLKAYTIQLKENYSEVNQVNSFSTNLKVSHYRLCKTWGHCCAQCFAPRLMTLSFHMYVLVQALDIPFPSSALLMHFGRQTRTTLFQICRRFRCSSGLLVLASPKYCSHFWTVPVGGRSLFVTPYLSVSLSSNE